MIAQGRDGSLYSNRGGRGINNDGAAYAITTGGSLTMLHSFDGTDGDYPSAGLILGMNGYFYGRPVMAATWSMERSTESSPELSPLSINSVAPMGCRLATTQAMDGKLYGVTIAGGS